nr:MAG TPA: hypothetical protein [Caudoviricetes sp.]
MFIFFLIFNRIYYISDRILYKKIKEVIKMHYKTLIKYWNCKELQGLKLKRAVEIIKQMEMFENEI